MKKVIARITIILLVIVLLTPNFINAAWTENPNGSWKTAYAYQISIVKYDGTGTPATQGKPILVYHPDLLQDVHTNKVEKNIPTSYDQYMSGNWGFIQMIDYKEDMAGYDLFNTADVYEMKEEVEKYKEKYEEVEQEYLENQAGKSGSGLVNSIITEVYYSLPKEEREKLQIENLVEAAGSGKFDSKAQQELAEEILKDKNAENTEYYYMDGKLILFKDMPDRFQTIEDKCGTSVYSSNYEVSDPDKYRSVSTPFSGHTDYINFIHKYMTSDRRITYYGKDVDMSKYNKTFSDSNLTQSAVNNGYLDDLVKRYAGSTTAIKENFGVDIDYRDIEKYYVSVEPVQRVLGPIYKSGASYQIATKPIEKIVREEITYSSDHYGPGEGRIWFIQGLDIFKQDFWRRDKIKCGTNTCSCGETATKYKYDDADKVSDKACTRRQSNLGYYTHDGKCYSKRTSEKYDPMNCACGACTYTYNRVADGRNQMFCGVKIIKRFYGKYAYGISLLVTARQMGASDTYMYRAVDYCDEEKNKHCELMDDNVTCKKDSNGNYIYQYYIGPDLERAITGNSSKNIYKINGTCYNGTGDKGIKHYYLETLIDCPEVCAKAGSKSGDEYLKCAENYCDAAVDFDRKGNAQKAKEGCIRACGYTTGATSCEATTSYAKSLEKSVEDSSTCGNNKEAVITTCNGDKINSFDGDDTNDTPFDQRKYISVSCKETSSFVFADTSKQTLTKGGAIDYEVTLNGKKECQAVFNENQWKFDYATISSKDPDRRKRLMYIKEYFNNNTNDSYDNTKSEYYDPDFAEQHDGEIPWEDYEYKDDKVKVTTRVYEHVAGKQKVSSFENLQLTNKDNKSVIHVNGSGSTKRIYSMKESSEVLNKYIQTSTVINTYKFNNRCIKADGSADVVTPDSSNVCYETRDKNGLVEKVFGRSVYYTDINIDTDGTNKVETVATVGKVSRDENTYYNNTDNCKLEMDISDEGLSCEIQIDPIDPTVGIDNDIYMNGNVKATVYALDDLGNHDSLASYSIKVRNTTYNQQSVEVGISDKKLAIETIEINGTVTSTKGIEGYCHKTINIVNPDDDCNVRCTLDKKSDIIYELRATKGTPSRYLRALSIDMTQREVRKSVLDGKYYIKLDSEINNPENSNLVIFGIVEGRMNSTGEVCKYTCNTPYKTLPSCTKIYKPAEVLKIKEYCRENYDRDINGYKTEEECVSKCSTYRKCDPTIQRDLEKVKAYCKANYQEIGFAKEDICVNSCYYGDGDNDDDSSTYIYRPINNANPFPNSYDSEAPYDKGSRQVGSNWVAFTDYIKHDDLDKTSVTGASANNKPEYVIDLTPDDIKKIKDDTKSIKRNGDNPYGDYFYVTSNKKGYVGEYESKFIHEDFYELFKVGLE